MNHLFEITNTSDQPTIAALGGKGYNLVRLTRGGFRVLEGFIVQSTAFDEFAQSAKFIEFAEGSNESLEEKCSCIMESISKTSLPNHLHSAINEMITKLNTSPSLPTPLLAVRSSGVTEDLEEASFAGMNDTILNVHADVDSVCDAVKACWKSLFSKRSVLYRKENGFPEFKTSIAVVVQVMIPSESSGVLFTADAQSGSRGEISLDGVQGLGEALVSGQVNTDHWTVRKAYGERPMHITKTSLGCQEFKLVSNYPNAGTTKTTLTADQGKASSFTTAQVLTVCSVACDIEKYYGKPMDIEFCYYHDKLYIVQARPITHLLAVPDMLNPLKNQGAPWFAGLSFHHVQMLTDPFSPMGTSAIRTIFGVSDRYITYVNGYLYINAAVLLSKTFIRNKFIHNIQKVMDKEMGLIVKEVYEKDYPFYKDTITKDKFSAFFKVFRGIAFNVITSFIYGWFVPSSLEPSLNKSLEEVIQNTEIAVAKMRNDGNLTAQGISAVLYRKIINIVHHVVPAIIISVICQSKIWKITAKYGIPDDEVELIWGNRRENVAGQMNHSVMRMAILLRKMNCADELLGDRIEKAVEEKSAEKVYAFVEECRKEVSDEDKQKFVQEWDYFMENFGFRGPAEFDISSPRYSDRPYLLLAMANNLDPTGYEDEEEGDRKREMATEKLLSKVTSAWDRWIIRRNLPCAQLLLGYRESHKYALIKMYKYLRPALLEVGEKLVHGGLLEKNDDIFFLELPEVIDFEKGKNDGSHFKGLVRSRRMESENGKGMQYPRFLFGPECIMKSVSDFTLQELENLPANVLKGTPTSAGVIEGRAVVATDPETAVVQKGDILVAKATDPGWTPLFMPAAGVVIEIGGPLTHGSVVARERGIPCVVGIIGLMDKLKTGMHIRVDGNKGTVEILDE